jgi:hypothetical protein
MIRIRGAADKAIVLPGSVDIAASTIAITLPDSASMHAAGMKPEVRGKEKKFYVDVSVDGGVSYDVANTPSLQLKL